LPSPLQREREYPRSRAAGAVLLADEPVAALDPRNQPIVLKGLKAHARTRATVAAILHDLSLAARFADRIVLLDHGKTEAPGSAEAVMTEARLASGFGIRTRVTREGGHLPVVAHSPLPDA
jgi:iron complex transport system ATP-binding protein